MVCSLLLSSLALTAAPLNYFTHLWQTEDGLPQNSVTAIVQTRDGYLWLGTYSGLARFDGVRFVPFNNGTRPKLNRTRITSLFEDSQGTLWIGNETGEVTRFRNRQFEDVNLPDAWQLNKVFAISADEAGDIWLVSPEALLVRLRDGTTLVPREGGATGQAGIARDTKGRLWIVRNGRLSRLEKAKLITVRLDQEPPDVYVQGICASRDGGIWISCNGRLRKWKNDHWAEDLGEAPWGVRGLTAMVETKNGNVAAGTVDRGLFLIGVGMTPLHLNHESGLSQDWIRSLCEDAEGDLWMGAGSGGLVALRAGRAASLSPPDHWEGRAVLSMSLGRDGSLWISTEGAGVYRFRNEQWEHFGERDGLSNLFVWSALEDEDGRLWAGTWGGGMFVRENGKFEHLPGLKEINAAMPAILHAPNRVTWIGSAIGLLRYEHGVVTSFGAKQGLKSADVRAIERAEDGTIWFGMTGGGLGRLSEDGSLKQFRISDGLSSDDVQSLKLEKDGTLWIGTAGGGLNRLRAATFAAITRDQGLDDNVISHIEEDARGFFWMSSHNGIMRVSKAELNACADGKAGRVNCLTYGKGEGLPTTECSGGMQPAGCKTLDGRFCFPTIKGGVVIDPNEVKRNERPPPVAIEEVLVQGKPTMDRPAGGRLQIPPGRQQVEFHYTGLSFVVPERVRFQYRLRGFERDWNDAGSTRAVTYSYLPPGDYAFEVAACNNDGVWNPQPASLGLTVLPYFWQTWWFRGGIGLVAAGLIAGAVSEAMRRRLRAKLEQVERQRAIERERTRIAQDIHDELGASLTRISMLSQSVRTELDHSEAAVNVDRIYDTARDVTRAMDEIVWAVNPQHDTLDSLATYLGKFAQDFLAAAHIRFRLEVPIQLPSWPLTAETRHNLFLAFKEALNNAVRHAGTKEVRVTLQIADERFLLRVQDEGCGFLANGSGSGSADGHARFSDRNGLRNMHQRLTEIGGRCEIHSSAGKGTIVEFSVPAKIPAIR